MSVPQDSISELIKSIAEPGVLIGHRFIAYGDEGALRPEESVYFQSAITKVRRQSGAARIVARYLLARLNYNGVAIKKTSSGAPVWPAGVVGSLAHEGRVALAAVARTADFLAVGIDIEPAEQLPDDLVDIVATAAERSRYDGPLLRSRQLFIAKEAVYKAVYPLDGRFLDFHDIEVDLEQQVAHISDGRTVTIKVEAGNHVIALAYLRNDHSISPSSAKSDAARTRD